MELIPHSKQNLYWPFLRLSVLFPYRTLTSIHHRGEEIRLSGQLFTHSLDTPLAHRLSSDKWWLSFSSKKNKVAQETYSHLLWNNTVNVQGTTIKDWDPCEDLVQTEMRYTSVNHGQGMDFQPFPHKSWLLFQIIYLTGKEYLPSANVPLTSIRCSDVMAKKGKRQTGTPEGSY